MKKIAILFLAFCLSANAFAQSNPSAKPWVFWYWMQASVSKEGITADLEAMKQSGIGGAYLMPIKGATNPPLFSPVTEQLSPRWWEMVVFALKEADRLGLKIGMHVSDGFALAGGPWISPELSMQKVVASQVNITGPNTSQIALPLPEIRENYYKDIAVYAYPSPEGTGISTLTEIPNVTSSTGTDASFLVKKDNKQAFSSSEPCWIQYEFRKPFTLRTITIRVNGNNYQAQRLMIQASDDGKSFHTLGRLEPPRHGWQDTEADYTHVVDPATARFFRFVYDKSGTEPGAEDLDAAKWKPSLKLVNLQLSSEPRINQFEAKSAAVWRISKRTTEQQVPSSLCVPIKSVINLTSKLNPDGTLNWVAPSGNWTILRVGHTSTGQKNATGGAGIGLECDKFNPAAIKLQFNSWYGEALKQAGPDLAPRVLNTFHVDSWECGSQNWSVTFRDEFIKRRGYDPLTFLPSMVGIPVESADVSEKFLYDVRNTISELITDTFYKTLADAAKEKGVAFTAESVAPTMVTDGLLHYKMVDIPMGEFWLNSPSHDKLNDMLDAVSGAHIYGKNIIQAEAFTTVRMAWNEHPGMLKTLQDRNYALGINKLVYHVFTHNPWLDRKPGMTLDGVGLYFQRNQTWWQQGKAWVEYAERCQELLQKGKPVTDIAVFTGEELPRRSVLPDRLVPVLPAIFGPEVVEAEMKRLANVGEPLRQKPAGVSNSANIADAENWVNPLSGYAYDSFNPDVLKTAAVKNGQVLFASGASYRILVVPGKLAMNPNYEWMSFETVQKLAQLVKAGATVILSEKPLHQPGLQNTVTQKEFNKIVDELWGGHFSEVKSDAGEVLVKDLGKGRVIRGIYYGSSFYNIGLPPDVQIVHANPRDFAFNHRASGNEDIYFISNQRDTVKQFEAIFRVKNKVPELYDAVSNKTIPAGQWRTEATGMRLSLKLEPSASVFITFKPSNSFVPSKAGKNWQEFNTDQTLNGSWKVQFDPKLGGPSATVTFTSLTDWSAHPDTAIKYYSGTAIYTKTFKSVEPANKQVWLDLGKIANIAEVKVNGISCGIVWTPPYRVDISKALKTGGNQLSVAVTNTWANRLIGDYRLPDDKRITQITAPYRLQGQPLQQAGLLGPVTIQTNK